MGRPFFNASKGTLRSPLGRRLRLREAFFRSFFGCDLLRRLFDLPRRAAPLSHEVLGLLAHLRVPHEGFSFVPLESLIWLTFFSIRRLFLARKRSFPPFFQLPSQAVHLLARHFSNVRFLSTKGQLFPHEKSFFLKARRPLGARSLGLCTKSSLPIAEGRSKSLSLGPLFLFLDLLVWRLASFLEIAFLRCTRRSGFPISILFPCC